MVTVFRQLAARTLVLPGVMPLMQRWNRDLGIIFMLHRIAWPDQQINGYDPEALRQTLAFLRRHGFRIVPVAELLRWARSPDRSPGPYVAFTLDDGYAEQATIATRIFTEFDAPATIFPSTGFLDGDLWMWWDRLQFVVGATERPWMPCPELKPHPEEVPLDTPAERLRVIEAIGRAMKRMAVAEREERLRELSETLVVEIPDDPPSPYAPMSWADARRCRSAGVTIGPHTVTHPTLSCESEERARREIHASWSRIMEEVDDPEPVFCYPNGKLGDFGEREARLVEEAGLEGAVTAEPGYVARRGTGLQAVPTPVSTFELPRYSCPDQQSSLIRITSGLSPDGRFALAPGSGQKKHSVRGEGPALESEASVATTKRADVFAAGE